MDEKTIDYDHVSNVYDTVRVGDPEMVQQILSGVHLSEESMVLDVGCGTANNTLLFVSACDAHVVGLDLSLGMLEKAGKKSPSIPLIQAPADALPFKDTIFDFVFMTEVIHHLPDPRRAIVDIYRVLKQNGVFCIVTQSHKQIESRMTSRFFPASIKVDQARYPDIDVLLSYLSDSGFSRTEVREYIFRPVRLGEDYLATASTRGYSMLHKISTEDYNQGLAELRAAFKRGEVLTYSARYSFVWGFKE
jgi:ubiquinone/menaquinone biosynthesis C-methylase UbiE